ncbi:PREDICTED: probable G-protein coupled receptor 158 isoform X1 [Cyprinodon variegatus]|uniref:probable G-protein coupled receptor 158 isoform X1 n=1 Tax=Cyprinodon variegatus TaxID=28743 RepID=UPI000742A832|nr:PREDICTED: probable G-protein coupled receptor 158 isoform X1 [Cyprinodon variegatus]
MAVFRLSLLLHVGFVIGSNRLDADRSTIGASPAEKIPGARLAHLRAPRLAPGEKSEDHLPRVVTAFLHTGDSTTLKHANCSRKYELTSLMRGRSHETPHYSMSGVLETVLHATNFLNMILQANRSKEHNLRRDIEWYHALVRSILEGDAKIHRAVVTFGGEASLAGPPVLLQATRADGEIVLQDLSRMAHRHLHNRTADTEWYHGMKEKKEPVFHRRVLNMRGRSPEIAESFIPDRTHVKWSAPFLECENGNFVPRWLLTLSAAFYGLKSNLDPEFRGVVRVDVNLQDVDIDQCSTDGWFAGTHRCNLTTMECLPLRGHGFVLDKYQCQCKRGFYHPNRVAVNGFTKPGRKGKAEDGGPGEDEGSPSDCLPCQQGCTFCKDNSPCVALEDGALRLAVLSFQCLCMLIVFISMVLVYHFRRNKSIRASGLVLLEAILCGAILLYFPVGILYFHPSIFRCILLRWVRLLGFATVYGTLTLKLYRVLKVFLSRTAQRIPYMTSWRVMRLLAIILLIVCWFLVAWTSAVCQNPDRKLALIDVGYTPDGSQFGMCLLDRWDYMMAVAEFLFLLWGVYLCYAVRTVPSAFHEPRYMAIAIHNELVLSSIFHVIRFTLAHELHPDWMLLLFFTHTHLTVTVTLGLLLIPKFLFAGTHMRDDIASEAYEDELDMGRSGSYLNSSITSAWSEHSLDPEDIRTPEEMGPLSSINGCGVRSCDSLWEKRTNEELKKLYSQLEIYKRKKMLANNPHLQKKRSSKKGLGRSLMRRITEIPESVHRQCSREDKELGDHGSNRNSICMLKKNPLDQSHQMKPAKEETLKNKVFSLKKSHSSYDHVRDQNEDGDRTATEKMEMAITEGSLLDTLMGKKLVKKKSSDNINAPSESTESVPLVCKSASAHNLTADKKPIHPRASMLQKSLSVIASAKEKTLGLTGKTQSSEDSNKKSQPKSKDTKISTETEEDCQTKMIISQSVEYKQSASKGTIMKQPVTSSQPTICSDPGRGKDLYDVSEVCPWELEDLPTPSENKVQKHVSIAPKETTTIHGGSTKGSKHHKQKASDQSPSSGRHSKESQKTTAVRAEVCPWEEGSESLSEGSRQQLSSQSKSNRPHSTLESSKTKRTDICPWDFEEQQKTSEMALSKETAKQKKTTSPVDVRGRTSLSDTSKRAASLHLPTTKAEICPWDYDSAAVSPNTDRTPSPAQAPKSKEYTSIKKGTTSDRTVEKEKSKDAEDEKSLTKAQDRNKSDKRLSQQKLSEVCPWDAESPQEGLQIEKRKSANVGAVKPKKAEVCPWDFEDTSSKMGSDKSSPLEKQSNPNPKGAAASSAKKEDVCPWDFDESISSKKA